MDEVFRVVYDDSQVVEGLNNTEKQLLQIQQQVEKTGDVTQQAFSGAKSAVNSLNTALDTATKATAEHAAAQNASAAGANAMAGAVGQTAAQTGLLTRALALARAALISLGIPALIALVLKLASKMAPLNKVMDEFSKIMAGAEAVLQVVADRIVTVGESIAKFFSGDFTGAAEKMKAAFTGIGDAISTAATAAYDLEGRAQKLQETAREYSVLAAKQNVILERQKAIFDDTTLSIKQRAAAAAQAGFVEQQIASRNLQLAKENREIALGRLALAKEDKAAKDEAAEAEIRYQDAIAEKNRAAFDAEQRRRELRKEAAQEAEKAAKERLKQLEEETKLLEKLRAAARPAGIEKDLYETNKQFDDLIKSAVEAEEKIREAQQSRQLTPDELQKIAELGELRKRIAERQLEALVDVALEYAAKEAEIDRKIAEEKEENIRDEQKRRERQIEDAKFLRDQQIDIAEEQAKGVVAQLEKGRASEIEVARAKQGFDLLIQRARLESELKFQRDLLSVTDKGDTQRVEEIRNNIALLDAQIKNLDAGGQKLSLLDRLGMDADTLKTIKGVFDDLISQLGQVAQARVNEAQAAEDAAAQKVAAAQSELDKEEELRKQGLANDTDLRKKELEAAKKQQEEAIKLREKAQKEEARIKRAAIIVDTIEQGQNLITASSKVFNSLAGIPFVGLPLAIAAVGLMFGAFAKAKVEAFKLAAPPKFKKGGKIEGRTHEEGGELIEAERGEWVVAARHSREHDGFLGNLNRGQYAGLDLATIADEAKGTITRHGAEVRDIRNRHSEATGKASNAELIRAYAEGSGNIVAAIKQKPNIYPFKEGYIKETDTGTTKTREVVLPE